MSPYIQPDTSTLGLRLAVAIAWTVREANPSSNATRSSCQLVLREARDELKARGAL